MDRLYWPKLVKPIVGVDSVDGEERRSDDAAEFVELLRREAERADAKDEAAARRRARELKIGYPH